MSNSSLSTRPIGPVLWEELLGSHITYYSLMFFIAYAYKGQVEIVSHSSCRTSEIFKYFCPLLKILGCYYVLLVTLPFLMLFEAVRINFLHAW